MKAEKSYEFRKRMLNIHEKNLRDSDASLLKNEIEIKDGCTIFIPEKESEVILTAARDLTDYLLISMNIASMVKRGQYDGRENAIVIALAKDSGVDLGYADDYRGYKVSVEEDAVYIYAHDERGAAQAIFYIEDLMSIRRAPFLVKREACRRPMFSPQMVHSGYGLDEYPDEHLNAIAHQGRDAILVFVRDVNVTPYGYLDFNELIYRASRYGIDVYAYSYLKSEKHPDDEGARAHYESTYGRLFKECPGLKGVTLVGESVEFPSKDPHISGHHHYENVVDGIPTGKTSPGFYPCEDYPKWLELIKKVVRKYNPEADIVFWTYNWGRAPEEARVKLINSLPTDISLQATFEMCEADKLDETTLMRADYTISHAEYGRAYFKTEAEAAKKRGIKLYSMTNTGGATWDMGVIPFQPYPYQWIKRYKEMKEAHEKWGLCGIMESHHYGFYPSIIGKLSNWVFSDNEETPEHIFEMLAEGEYGKENAPKMCEAFKKWSEAINYFVPSDGDQYGAFRVGPSFPLCLYRQMNLVSKSYAMFGSRIVFPHIHHGERRAETILSRRIHEELASLEKMFVLFKEGLEIMRSIQNKNENIERMLNMGEFMLRTIISGINSKKWYYLKNALHYEKDKDKLAQIIDDMEALLKEEKQNAEDTIPFVQLDSRLGWEPSMEYMTDEEHLRWKMRQIDYVINTEIANTRRANNI